MAKYLPPTEGVLNKRIHIEATVRLAELLSLCNHNIKDWCASIGFVFREVELPPHVPAIVRGEVIYVTKGLSHDEKIWCIGHEFFHREFHAPYTLYNLDQVTINKLERQANAFAEALKVHVYG